MLAGVRVSSCSVNANVIELAENFLENGDHSLLSILPRGNPQTNRQEDRTISATSRTNTREHHRFALFILFRYFVL